MSKAKKEAKDVKKETISDQKIQELEEKSRLADEYLDQLQRLKAEYDNYRKRVTREKEEYRKYILEEFLYNLLGVVDNIERAITVSSENHKFSSLLDGMNIVQKQFVDLLKAQGVASLGTKIGDDFNPHLHHAVSHEVSEYPVDSITKIMQAGYKIGDRVLRPAMVVVSSGPENTALQEEAENNE